MKSVFAYIRVSTPKQGTQGSSLQEQRSAIEAYAQRAGLHIAEWFEESETAAKSGRPAFSRMMRALACGSAQGVVIHKIDRSARNLRDWADLGDLIDKGIEVHFAHETLDMRSRGGRLAADIQAVVAADFIRNLRDEVRKGFYGRLKQGIYPLQAPIGYRDMGSGKAKAIDPVKGPLVRQAFELYATGDYNFRTLRSEMTRRGLHNRGERPLSRGALTTLLNNPFYMGLIHLKKTGETFQGAHPPLIRKALYDQVQAVLRGNRLAGAAWTHEFLFRRMIRCVRCHRVLIGEKQKQRYVYYRCHDRACGLVSLSENKIESLVASNFNFLQLDAEELEDMRDMLEVLKGKNIDERAEREGGIRVALAKCDERLSRLTDALIDGDIDKEAHNMRKDALLKERRSLEEQLETIGSAPSKADRIARYLELSNTAHLQYQNGLAPEKRDMIAETTSNFVGEGNNPVITLKSPFQEMLDYRKLQCSAPHQDDRRTRVKRLFDFCLRAAEVEVSAAKASQHPSSP